jgi:hypothetical protein
MRAILSKILFCDELDLDNVLMHIPVGIINTLICCLSGWLGLIFAYGFIKYERIEQKDIHDKAYPDIQGWLWGIGISAIIIGIIRWC